MEINCDPLFHNIINHLGIIVFKKDNFFNAMLYLSTRQSVTNGKHLLIAFGRIP